MKLAIVNDLPMAREALRRAVALQPEHQVIWMAKDGTEAVERCAAERPDLVLMDLIMPGMDGVAATRKIMAQSPCAILIVTSSVGANAARAFEAMGHGALDAVDTPALGSGDLRKTAAPLLAKIATLGRLIEGGAKEPGGLAAISPRGTLLAGRTSLVAIGASAGGPAAVAAVLKGLPADFPGAVVVVQHVDVQFAPGMADWLGLSSKLPVRVAREGDAPQNGVVLLACSNDHLVLKTPAQLGYVAEPREYVYRPSVDVFFQSVAYQWPGRVTGVLLTGMGRDGALGLKALRNVGFPTIAQDEATCAVYGMPKAAARLDAASDILPLDRIAPKLVELSRAP
jgi:chemotaxis response regulator CheB